MKLGLSFCLAISMATAAVAQPRIAECFKVYNLIKMDADHYWADWANACPYTIDSVYVMVQFSGRSSARLGNGVWALHFVLPGAHQVTRWTTPLSVPDFDFIQVRKITTDWLEALSSESGDHNSPAQVEGERAGGPGQRRQLATESNASMISAARVVSGEGHVAEVAATRTRRTESLSAEEHNRRGRALIEEGKYAAAIDELSEAIQKQPGWPLAYNARGFAYYMEQDYRHALADLDEAIRLNPRYLNAYQNRSRSRKAAGDTQGSAADSKTVRALLGTR